MDINYLTKLCYYYERIGLINMLNKTRLGKNEVKQYQIIILASIFLMLFLFVFTIGCSTPNTVQKIIILPRPSGDAIPPGGWALDPSTNPFPSKVQEVFQPGQELIIGIKIDEHLKNNVTFSKVTLFNRETMNEVVVISSDLGPFEPGQAPYLPYYAVPNEKGSYEVRIYIDQKVIASALFEVN